MNVELKAINAVTTEIKILVPADEATSKWNKHLVKYGKKVEIAGFRKGKAPFHMVERLYSAHALESFYHQMVDDYFEAAVKQENLEYLLFPDVKDIDWEKGKDLEMTIEIEHEPAIEFKQLDNLRVPYTPITLESEVDLYLEKLRKENTRIVDAEEAANEDTVDVEYTMNINDEARVMNGTVQAGGELPNRSIPELIGKKTGDVIQKDLSGMMIKLSTRDSSLALDNDAMFPVSIMINSIRHNQIPELDDDFAKDLEFDSLDAMKAKIADEMREANTARELNNQFGAIMTKLYVDNQFDLPKKTIEYLAEREAENEPNEAYRQYLEYQYRIQLSQELMGMYLKKVLRAQLNIEVTPELTEEYIKHLAILEDISPEAYKEANKDDIAAEEFKMAVENYGAFMQLIQTAEFYIHDPATEAEETVEEAELVEPQEVDTEEEA